MRYKILLVALFNVVALVKTLPSNSGKADEPKCGFQSCHKTDPDLLNVHLVAHTHDDVGWLKTADQYYYGSQGGIQKAGVQYIIDSVIQGLLESPDRRFVYVESAFFSKWWYEQNESLQEEVKMLVNEGRLEFIGGAWSMNDEATTHYQSIVDQFTWGTRFLNDTFGECARPRIAWQIDPFGHSKEQASLFTKMGYDGLFVARLDYQNKQQRMSDKSMEMVWEASSNLDDSDMFTSALYNEYASPRGFCFDILCDDEPFIDDPRSFDYNVDRRVKEFVDYVKEQASKFRTNNVILTMGEDFHYMNAGMNFKNMEKLIKYTNAKQSEYGLNVIYSTPSCYLKALHEADIAWPTKSDDFMPYASDAHAYWTGYYTSRPTSKRFERMGNQFLQICKQLSVSLSGAVYEENLNRLRAEMGVMQHHDAVTGTEKQHVANDYHRELTESFLACEDNTKATIKNLMNRPNEPVYDFNFVSCLNLNISDCSVSENSENFIVNVYNPLGHSTSQHVRIPVKAFNFEVRDFIDMTVDSQLVPIAEPVLSLKYRTAEAVNELVFKATDIPPLGSKSFHISRLSTEYQKPAEENASPLTIGSESLSVTFDSKGLLSSISVDGEAFDIKQNFLWYKGAVGDNREANNRSSGAYIFRPDPLDGNAREVVSEATLVTYKNDQVDEVHQTFNEWISQVIRIYKNLGYVEFEWLVGPIPITDGENETGKEIVTRYTTSMNTDGVFETDSNGREMLKRKRNFRETWDLQVQEPVAGNYYPVNTKISIEDSTHRLSLLPDRAQGGSSIIDGTVELMVHRRLLRDDAFGVGEALNEQSYGDGLIARGKHWLVFGKKSDESPTMKARERILQNQLLMSNWLFFDRTDVTSSEWSSKYVKTFNGMGELPKNIYMMTLEPWKDKTFLVRFEHILEKDDDPILSLPVSLDLTKIFFEDIYDFYETNLAGNQWIEDLNRLQFKKVGAESSSKAKAPSLDQQKVLSNKVITLNPMQIRTFVMEEVSQGQPKSFADGMKSKIQTLFSFVSR